MNPVVIVYGINLISEPSLRNPIRIRSKPANTVARARPDIPFFATIPATMVANAAVGPAICTRLPPRKDIMKPAIIAVYIPCSGPTPEASASAIDKGSAIIATMIPETTSVTHFFPL